MYIRVTTRISGYGVLVLSQLPLNSVEWFDFPTRMGRKLHVAQLTVDTTKVIYRSEGHIVCKSCRVPNRPDFECVWCVWCHVQIAFGTVHLESLGAPKVRQEQLKVCKQVFDALNADVSILCGMPSRNRASAVWHIR